jgi:trimeric autotransporter adhesin
VSFAAKLFWQVLSFVCFTATLCAQPPQLQILAPVPAAPTGGGAVVGAAGAATVYYWVVARYPGGNVQSQPIPVLGTVGAQNFNATNYVNLTWSYVPSATGYDVVRNATSAIFPAPCTACAVAINTNMTTASDTGGGMAYTAGGTLNSALATLYINNTTLANPALNANINGTIYQIAPPGSGGGTNLSGAGAPSNALCTQAGLGYINTLTDQFYVCPVPTSNVWGIAAGTAGPTGPAGPVGSGASVAIAATTSGNVTLTHNFGTTTHVDQCTDNVTNLEIGGYTVVRGANTDTLNFPVPLTNATTCIATSGGSGSGSVTSGTQYNVAYFGSASSITGSTLVQFNPTGFGSTTPLVSLGLALGSVDYQTNFLQLTDSTSANAPNCSPSCTTANNTASTILINIGSAPDSMMENLFSQRIGINSMIQTGANTGVGKAIVGNVLMGFANGIAGQFNSTASSNAAGRDGIGIDVTSIDSPQAGMGRVGNVGTSVALANVISGEFDGTVNNASTTHQYEVYITDQADTFQASSAYGIYMALLNGVASAPFTPNMTPMSSAIVSADGYSDSTAIFIKSTAPFASGSSTLTTSGASNETITSTAGTDFTYLWGVNNPAGSTVDNANNIDQIYIAGSACTNNVCTIDHITTTSTVGVLTSNPGALTNAAWQMVAPSQNIRVSAQNSPNVTCGGNCTYQAYLSSTPTVAGQWYQNAPTSFIWQTGGFGAGTTQLTLNSTSLTAVGNIVSNGNISTIPASGTGSNSFVNTGFATAPFFTGRNSAGSVGAPTASTVAAGSLVQFIGQGYNATTYATGGSMYFIPTGTWSGSSYPTSFNVSTTAVNSTTPTVNFEVDQNGQGIFSAAGVASSAGLTVTGAAYTGGNGTTNFPQLYINNGASGPTTLSTSGTQFGINATSGFAGNFFDFRINGGASLASIGNSGAITLAAGVIASGSVQAGAGQTFKFGTTRDIIGNNGADQTLTITGSAGGNIGVASSAAAQSGTLCIGSTGIVTYDPSSTCLVSSRFFKHDINAVDNGLNIIRALKPVSFVYNDDANEEQRYGLIAEDVEKVAPRLVIEGADGAPLQVKYLELIPLLIKTVQEQQSEIESLKQAVRAVRTVRTRRLAY